MKKGCRSYRTDVAVVGANLGADTFTNTFSAPSGPSQRVQVLPFATTAQRLNVMAPALGPRPLPKVLVFSILPVAAWFVFRPLLDPVPPLPALHASVGFALFAFVASVYLVPALGPTFLQANRSGKDLLKTDPTLMCVEQLSFVSGVLTTLW
jgi:hypothetical protein